MPEVDLGPVLSDDDAVRFVEAHRPALPDGEYELTLRHALENHGFAAERRLKFAVTGPRFSLPGTERHSSFPPRNASGAFETVLPHVILERASLPWERTALPPDAGVDAEDLPPWIALLVFTEDEVEQHTRIVDVAELTGGATHAGWTALPPEPSDDPGQKVLVLDLPGRLASHVLPTIGELALLTSVRVVNDTTSRAIIVANRLCKPGARHIAHLVSLEGQYRARHKAQPSDTVAKSFEHWSAGGTHAVRLISLAQWSFQCTESPGDFHRIVSSVTPGHLALSGAGAHSAGQAAGAGAIPLRHLRAEGAQTASWYHGPLAVASHQTSLPLPVRHAEELLLTDSATGMVDISYAAAWQLGRLIALHDPNVGRVLYQWKRKVQHALAASAHLQDNPAIQTRPADPPPFPLAAWFENALGRLAAVPFDYLVPDPMLLPPETIAFFALDRHWLMALYDGAFSIGRTGRRRQMLDAAHKAHLPFASSDGHPLPPRSGFLLRSRAVSGWPDLIVDGFDANGTALGAPIRFERLGKDVLMVLFEGRIARAEIHLHPQAMHFGFDGAHDTGLSKMHNGRPITPKLRPHSRTLDLLDAHGAGFAADIAAATAHDFAFRMIEGVPRVTFTTEVPDA